MMTDLSNEYNFVPTLKDNTFVFCISCCTIKLYQLSKDEEQKGPAVILRGAYMIPMVCKKHAKFNSVHNTIDLCMPLFRDSIVYKAVRNMCYALPKYPDINTEIRTFASKLYDEDEIHEIIGTYSGKVDMVTYGRKVDILMVEFTYHEVMEMAYGEHLIQKYNIPEEIVNAEINERQEIFNFLN